MRHSVQDIDELQKAIGYFFNNKNFLINALTHSSYVNECVGAFSNERMEFLGDSILSFVTAEYLYNSFSFDEGELSKKRSILVNEKSLYKIALHYDLSKYLRFGGTFRKDFSKTGSLPISVLADSVEAIIAGIFLDGGIEPAKEFVLSIIRRLIEVDKVFDSGDELDYKSLLQVLVQKKTHKLPEYKCREIKDKQDISFAVSIFVDNQKVAETVSATMKGAKKECAKKAYIKLKSVWKTI